MILQPLEDFTIVRGLEDWTDSTQYYVQAVIRNAKTDALIATIQLTDQGDHHRYSKKWQVPADQTGLGFYIVIETSVYSDSGYTSKASAYGDKYETYLIQERVNPLLNRGGGSEDIDYKRIAKIVSDEVSKQIAAMPDPDKPEVPNIPFHLQPVLNALSGVRSDINKIDIPKADFSGVESRLNTLEQAIKAIDIPVTDLSPVLQNLNDISSSITPYTQEVKTNSEGIFDRIKQFFTSDMDEIKAAVAGLETKFDSIAFIALQQVPKQTVPKKEVDYSQVLKP